MLKKGYCVYTDNSYTKPALADFLSVEKTILVGTVRRNSKSMSEAAGSKLKLKVGENQFRRRGDLLFCAFREKKSQTKPVLLFFIYLIHQKNSDYLSNTIFCMVIIKKRVLKHSAWFEII